MDISPRRRVAVRTALPILLVTLHALPLGLSAQVFAALQARSLLVAVFAATSAYLVLFPIIAGVASRPFQYAIVEGRFPRDLGHRVYGPRRLYAACWTTLYYHPIAYHVVLALPWLKTATFRLFGYRGSTTFTLYPDTWIRDLPLLSIGEGAYLANKATVSPNLCLHDGSILIESVLIGEKSMLGHSSLIAPGVTVGRNSEIGVATSLSLGTQIGDDVRIGHCCDLDRGVVIAQRCRIGEANSIGANASIPRSTRTRFGLTVPSRARITSEEQLTKLAEQQGKDLQRLRASAERATIQSASAI